MIPLALIEEMRRLEGKLSDFPAHVSELLRARFEWVRKFLPEPLKAY